jgi:hypothetical protein
VYTVYKTINNTTKEYYIGVHKTNNPNDGYLGSGIIIKRSVEKYGRNQFDKIILVSFDNEKDAYDEEVRAIGECYGDPLCLNIDPGGRGGFCRINKARQEQPELYPNPMTITEIKLKSVETNKRRFENDDVYRRRKIEVAIDNLKRTNNEGRKRPRQAMLMRDHMTGLWETKRDVIIDSMSGSYQLISPEGRLFETNRLTEFCKQEQLPFVSIWSNTKYDKPITKGKAKGWCCVRKS